MENRMGWVSIGNTITYALHFGTFLFKVLIGHYALFNSTLYCHIINLFLCKFQVITPFVSAIALNGYLL